MALRGQKVILRDKQYDLAPLPLDQIEEVWPSVLKVISYNANAADAVERQPEMIKAAVDVVLAAMRTGNNIEMTRERLMRDVLDLSNWKEAFFAALAVSNIKLVERKPGEAPALVAVKTPIGTGSESTSPAPSDGISGTSAA